MRFLLPTDMRRPGAKAGLILLASGAVGFAYNALNPAGIRLHLGGTAPGQTQMQAPAGPYRVETISARLEPSGDSAVASVGAGAAVLLPPVTGGKTGAATAIRTTWENVTQLVERGEAVLVDSRPRLTYEAGHVPGAVNLPLDQIVSEIEKFASAHPPAEARLIIYCSNESCPTSSSLAAVLTQKYGYRDVKYVSGGYLEWLKTKTGESQ